MDNTSTQSNKDIIDAKDKEVHQIVKHEVKILQQSNDKDPVVDQGTYQPLNPIQQLIKDRISNWMQDMGLCKPSAQSYQQTNVAECQKLNDNSSVDKPALSNLSREEIKERLKKIVEQHQKNKSITTQHQSSESSECLNHNGFADKPAPPVPQEYQQSNISTAQKNEVPNKQVVVGKRSLKKYLNTRGTMYQMSNENMNELRKIIHQHQKNDSVLVPQKQSIEPKQLNVNSSVIDQGITQAQEQSIVSVSQAIDSQSTERLDENNSLDNQKYQQSDISTTQKDEVPKKQDVVGKRPIKKRSLNTRGTMYQMSNENMNELRKIIHQHQKNETVLAPQKQSSELSKQSNDNISVVDQGTTRSLRPIIQSIESKALSKPLANVYRQSNVSVSQTDEMQKKQNFMKHRSIKKRNLNTRGAMYQMSNENMTELRNIIHQHKKNESIIAPQKQSIEFVDTPQTFQHSNDQEHQITLLRKKYGVEMGLIEELKDGRKVKVPKQRKINSLRQNTAVKSVREKPVTIPLQKLPRNKIPLQSEFGVETGFIKELANRKMMIKTPSSNNKDIKTDINLKLTSYDECWISSNEIYRNISKIPSLSTIKEVQLDSIDANVYDECWPQPIDMNLLNSYKVTLPMIAEETNDLLQMTPLSELNSKESTRSVTNVNQQPASIREYLALPETYKVDLQSSEKFKKIFMSKKKWSKRVEKKKTKAELEMFLELTKQQMDAIVLETESDNIWIETHVRLKKNETHEFKQDIHKMVSRLETKLEKNQQPSYLLRKELEKVTNKLASTKRWKISRVKKLQHKLHVISQSLTKVHDTNNFITEKIAGYNFHYVNNALAM